MTGLHVATDRNGLPLEPDDFDTATPTTIVCPDCGGVAHLITHLDAEAPLEAGEAVAYRCVDCLDRWDVIWEEPDIDQ